MNKIISFVTFILCFTNIQSQNYGDKTFYLTDSLDLETLSEYDRQLVDTFLTEYHNTDNDSLKIYYVNQINNKCYSDELMSIYNEIALEKNSLFLNKNTTLYKENIGEYYGNVGYLFDVKYESDSALFYYQKSMVIRKELKSNDDIGTSYIQIGRVYSDQNLTKKALSSYKDAIKYLEKTTNYTNLAIAYNYVAFILKKDERFNDALFFLEKAAFYTLKADEIDYTRLGDIYNGKADIYNYLLKHDKALTSIDTALLYHKKTNKQIGLGHTYYSYAKTYRKLDNRIKEKLYNDKALEIAEIIKKDGFYAVIFSSISKYYLTENDLNKAEKFALKSLSYSEKTTSVHLISDYILLEKIYVKKKQYKKAYQYKISSQELIDKKNTEKEDAILKYKIEYDFEQEKKHAEFVHQKEIELAEAEKQKSFNAMLAFGIILLLVALFSVYIFNQLKIIRKQKIQLEESKKNELAVSNLKALKSQMNPHFIFNLLNSIQYMVLQGDVENSYDFINQFAGLVRNTLDYSDREKILLSEEIKLLEVYMKLEKLRFQDDLEYEFIKTDIREVELPPMLIQPFIENALIHGLLHKKGLRKLKITFKIGKTVECTVEDNGIGRKKAKEIKDRQKSSHKSFSTNAIEKRFSILQDTYKEDIGYTYYDLEPNENSGTTTKVVINIPFDEIEHTKI